jgi:multidrug resistance efflux pump
MGFVTNVSLDVGDYATPGKPVVALIDSDSYRVDARNYNTDTRRRRFRRTARL